MAARKTTRKKVPARRAEEPEVVAGPGVEESEPGGEGEPAFGEASEPKKPVYSAWQLRHNETRR